MNHREEDLQTNQSRDVATDPAMNFALGINSDNARRPNISRENGETVIYH